MDLSGPSRGAAGLDFRKSSQQAVELKENLRAVRDTQSFAKALKSPPLVGLDAMFTIYQRDEELRSFFPHTLPFIVEKAGELPKYFPSTPSLKRLEQNCPVAPEVALEALRPETGGHLALVALREIHRQHLMKSWGSYSWANFHYSERDARDGSRKAINMIKRVGRAVLKKAKTNPLQTYPAPHFRYFTTHRALSHIVGNFDVLYVDEFTCFDFRVVIAVAFNHGVSKIVLVGDPKQNVIRPEYGWYADGHILSRETEANVPLLEMPGALFKICFRCPGGDVMRLNALGYQVIPYWKTPSGTKVITGDPGDTWDGTLPGGDDCLRIAFTHEDAERFCMNRKHTVASMQGGTTEHVALFFTAGAFALAKSVFNQNHVALSRHTKTLTVIGDGSSDFHKWASMLKLTETFAIVVDTCIEAPQGPVAVPVPDPDFLKFNPDLAPFGIQGNFAARLDALRDPTTRDDAPAQPDEDKLARAIVRQFSERHFKDTLNTSAFSENNLTLIRANITRAAIQKGYALRLEAADTDRRTRDQRVVTFYDGLSDGPMVATRAMSQHFVRNCKPHAVFDLEKPTDVFLAEVEELLQNTPGSEDIFTDQEEFDANQNVWTRKVERLFWEHLRIPVEILEGHGEEYQALDRGLVLSLMAQMFLCLLDAPDRAMPACSFEQLLCPRRPFPQEVAKLRMFVHYFERCRLEPPKGELRIWRQVRTEKASTAAWKASKKPLLPMQVADRGVGLEDEMGRGCLHADFANMYLGGGVLVGGCVQEEIRFAICPELCAAMVICPYMLDHEAITIVGGEQFSAYSGYGRSLAYAGDFRDPTPKDEDGTVLVAITAMDALDFRGQEVSLSQQLRDQLLLRELEKAAIAFAPTDEAALRRWPVIATGNWGCGAFGGCVELKAILQWLAASEASRQLLYFPYDVPLGPALSELADTLTRQGATVGSLFTALTSEPTARRSQDLFEHLRERLAMHGG
ncbi:Parg [Symbiodinium sp. KB8]|nr:Parg [Symbiodinium sp. KB8]